MTDLDKEQLANVAGGGVPFWFFCHFHPWNKNDLCWDATPFSEVSRYPTRPRGWRDGASDLWKKTFK